MILLAIHGKIWIHFLGFHHGEGFQAFRISRPIAPVFLNRRCLRSSDLVQPFVAPCCRPVHLALPTLDQTCIITHITCHRYHLCPGRGLPRSVRFRTVTALLVCRLLFIGLRGCANCIVTAITPSHLALASHSLYLSRSIRLSSSQRGPLFLFVEGDKTYICTSTYYTSAVEDRTLERLRWLGPRAPSDCMGCISHLIPGVENYSASLYT